MIFSLIAALAENRTIGINGKLPWHLPNDLKRFKMLTMGKPIIMGRKTFESLGRLLPGREHLILTRDPSFQNPQIHIYHSIEKLIEDWKQQDELMVIGGAEIYQLFLPICQRLHLTRVQTHTAGDTFFPSVDLAKWERIFQEKHPADEHHAYPYTFETWERKNSNKEAFT